MATLGAQTVLAGTPPIQFVRRQHRIQGYPRLSALIHTDRDFAIFRCFGRLHARVLLHKQDELVALEERLEHLDNNEQTAYLLQSSRNDRGGERRKVVEEIADRLLVYNKHLKYYYANVTRPKSKAANVQSLCNWMKANKPIDESESTFLQDWDDLRSPNERVDEGGLNRILEKCAVALKRRGYPKASSPKTDDKTILLFSDSRVLRVTRFLVTVIAIITLTVPIAVLFNVASMSTRLWIISAFTALFSSTMCWLTQTRSFEIFSATAAYCAVMVVFVGNLT
ncbi:hypothetical protein P154DRAFT_546514 [Amniculicola lignicola CBS 123094]|uniref:DUF6594 domain-containing protein n=1 Tax=Amniculicola lignicola CBS 123094 TaxID=1392246 RepID=A0A6A5WAN7_9PLEO|nr:hypothetical protein P154DRAFT_546514 [Amniculicola lignicola CBS 123094]